MARRKRTHVVAIRLHFDQPCTQDQAVRAARDAIHGEFYTGCYQPRPDYSLPDEMRIGGFSTLRNAAKRIAPDALPKPKTRPKPDRRQIDLFQPTQAQETAT